ncbi:MAG: LacI family DNA-binding transcriptional regulator, partial [Planctomycetota bacterium]
VSTEELEQSLPTVLDKFLEQRISGAFLIDFDAISQEDVALIKTDPGLRELDLTYSNCDRALPGLRIDADDYDGGRQVVEHLIELGHRKIGYVGPIGTDTSSSHVRWEGFSDTLEKVGLPITDKLLHDVDWVPPPTQSLRADWLKDTKAARKARPTALLCANDQIACRVIRHARRHNIRVPQDLSVVGFSDELMGRFVDPPLTSVSQNRYDMGRAAIERLIDQHEARDGGLADPPTKPRNGRRKTVKRGKPILTPVKLVIRDSTGPVPDTA